MPHIPLYSTHTYLLLHTSCNPPQPPRATPTAPHGPTLPYSPLSSHIPTTSPPLPLHPQTTSAPGGTGSSAGGSGGPGPDAGSSAAAVGAPSPSAVPKPRIPRRRGGEGGAGPGGSGLIRFLAPAPAPAPARSRSPAHLRRRCPQHRFRCAAPPSRCCPDSSGEQRLQRRGRAEGAAPSDGTAGRPEPAANRRSRALRLSQSEPAALPLANETPEAGRSCR